MSSSTSSFGSFSFVAVSFLTSPASLGFNLGATEAEARAAFVDAAKGLKKAAEKII